MVYYLHLLALGLTGAPRSREATELLVGGGWQ